MDEKSLHSGNNLGTEHNKINKTDYIKKIDLQHLPRF